MLFDRFFDAIDHWAAETPDAQATWFAGTYMTYAELKGKVDRFAAALVANGVRKGDVVAGLTTPRPEFLVALAAVYKAGAVYLGINPSYTAREQMHVVSDSRPVMIFSLASFDGRQFYDEIEVLAREVDSVRATFRLDDGPAVGCLKPVEEFLAAATGREEMPEVDRMDPSTIVYTSGSSGTPKGAVLPNFGVSYASHCNARLSAIPEPRVLCNLPTNHVGCIVSVQGSTVVVGGMVAYTERFDPAEMLRLVEELRITNLMHVPTVLQFLAMHPDFDKRDLSSLQIVAWAGAALPVEFVRKYHAKGVRLITAYGMTESCGHVAHSGPDDTVEQLATTVGRPNPDADVRLVDEEGNEVPDGEEGEVLYRNKAKFLYYLNNPAASAAAVTPDGFLRTGDVAVRLPSGHMRLVGRRSEMYKSGGLNVYPREVELVLQGHDAVSLAAVVGIADPAYGEVGAAYVVCKNGRTIGPEELKAWCKERLAGYKVPKSFEVRTELPLLPVGKVDKQALRREHG